MNTEQRLVDMTLGDLLAILDSRDEARRKAEEQRGLYPETVYGLDGLCQLFGISKATAYRLKHSGKIDAAIIQIGSRKFAVNSRKALELCKL